MPAVRRLAAAAVLAAAASAPANVPADAPVNATGDLAVRALTLASGLTQCGVFPSEQLWQAGSTLETFASLSVALQQPQLYATIFQAIYDVTPVIVDNCYDGECLALTFFVFPRARDHFHVRIIDPPPPRLPTSPHRSSMVAVGLGARL